MYVYVASSWRNEEQPVFCDMLSKMAIAHYDFRNPPERTGFGWQDVMIDWDINDPLVRPNDYLYALEHPMAEAGFTSDMQALKDATHVVLLLPCNRSAHLELGWAVGAGKRTALALEDPCEPELMYRMVDYIAASPIRLLDWLRKENLKNPNGDKK
jgi:hypothetical protein